MKTDKINLLDHYRRIVFYNFNRFKDDNAKLMSEYFASVLIMEVEEFMPLWDKKVLDVGGGRGIFCKVINEKRRCEAVNYEPNPGNYIWENTKIGLADNISFKNNEFDVVICRGVLEHISSNKQQQSINEMYRVTKPGGICYILIPPWYNPHAGHSVKPFHILPFKVAKFLRQLVFRDKIEANSFEEAGLYPVTYKTMKTMISKSGFQVLATKDTHFRLHFLTKIPIIREIAVPAIAFILKK